MQESIIQYNRLQKPSADDFKSFLGTGALIPIKKRKEGGTAELVEMLPKISGDEHEIFPKNYIKN